MLLLPRDMTSEEVRQILAEVAAALEDPETVARLEQAKKEAGNEFVRRLKTVYPIIRQIKLDTIARHGYDNSTEGLVQFTERVRDTESQDSEIARLHILIRNHYLPYEPLPMSLGSMLENVN